MKEQRNLGKPLSLFFEPSRGMNTTYNSIRSRQPQCERVAPSLREMDLSGLRLFDLEDDQAGRRRASRLESLFYQ